MSKQEEIDLGLRQVIMEWMGAPSTQELYDFSKAIRVYLDSEGVVILNPDVPIERCSFVKPLLEPTPDKPQ